MPRFFWEIGNGQLFLVANVVRLNVYPVKMARQQSVLSATLSKSLYSEEERKNNRSTQSLNAKEFPKRVIYEYPFRWWIYDRNLFC